jgi:putative iron-only hydrogenase system regulator
MEKRIGAVTILLEDTSYVSRLNSLLSEYGSLVLGRQGVPIRERGIRVISLIVEGTTDEIGAMTGKIGRLPGVQVKSVLTKYREVTDENPSQDLS